MGLVIGDKVLAGAVIGDKVVAGMVLQDKVIYRAGAAPPTENAQAPTFAIGAVANVNEGVTATLFSTVTGGVYDTIDYAWSIVSGGGTIVGNGATAQYTSASITANITAEVQCVVTVTGTGTLAINGTSDTVTDTEDFTVVNQTPAADAPSITIASQGNVSELVGTVDLTATISGGTYDAITYAWEVVTGGGSIAGNGLTATYTVPNVTADTPVTIRVTATATGTGTLATNGTSDTASDTEDFNVFTIHGVVRFPAGAVYAGLAYHPSTGDLVSWDTTNEQIVRVSRGGVADSPIALSDVPDGVTYRDIAVDVSGHFHMWRNLGSGATVDRYDAGGTYQSTVSMATDGGPRFALDIQSNDYISMHGNTLRVWEHDGTVRSAHIIASGVETDEDVIVDFIQGTATHVYLVSDGHRVNLSTGATDIGLDNSWPQRAPGLPWQFGYEDPTAGGAIWLGRSDGVVYRVGSGSRVPGAPLNQDEVVQLFRDAGLAVYAGTMGAQVQRTGGDGTNRWVIFDPGNNQGFGATGSWDAQHDVTDNDNNVIVPVLDRMQWFDDLPRFVFNRSGTIDFEDWINQASSRVYMVRISSGTDDVNEYLCIGPATNGNGGGSSWLNIMPTGAASSDWLRVASESKHGSIEGSVMQPGDTTIPGLLDDRWLSWVRAEWSTSGTGREFVVALGASDTPVPLVVP